MHQDKQDFLDQKYFEVEVWIWNTSKPDCVSKAWPIQDDPNRKRELAGNNEQTATGEKK